MPNLNLQDKSVRQFDNLYSLNDLHKLSGGASKHRPNQFLRLEQTQALIAEIEHYPDMGSTEIQQCADMRSAESAQSRDSGLAQKTINGGKNRGTYACKELVYAYAMWISPKFHLEVIRAFDALQAAPAPSALPRRFLVSIEHDGTERVSPIPQNAIVASFEELPAFIRESVGVSNEVLSQIAHSCLDLLAHNASNYRQKLLNKKH